MIVTSNIHTTMGAEIHTVSTGKLFYIHSLA